MANNAIYCNLNASLTRQNSEKESRRCRTNVQLGKARMMSWNDIEDARKAQEQRQLEGKGKTRITAVSKEAENFSPIENWDFNVEELEDFAAEYLDLT